MNNDLVSILANLSRSLFAVQKFIAGLGYLVGLLLIITAIMKLKKIANSKSSEEKIFVPIAFMLAGMALLFLPSTLGMLSNSIFGNANILQYSSYNPNDIYNSMGILTETAGLIWFVRGCNLLAKSSEPGAKNGAKGLGFLIAGILAMNISSTSQMLNDFFTKLSS